MRLFLACLLAASCGGSRVDDLAPDGGGDPDASLPGDDPTPLADAAVTDAAAADAAVADAAPPSRVVAIGDLHGDLSSTLEAFRVGGLIDADAKWIGGNAWAVQVGDQLDRGSDEDQIQDFLDRIALEAEAAGGRVVVLNGNHELMNVDGNFDYVTPGGLADFGGLEGRTAAFAPGGPMAIRLADRPFYLVAEDTLFVHGGITPAYADEMAALDAEARAWMRGEQTTRPALLTDFNGPVWDRTFGYGETEEACDAAEATMAAFGVHRLVVAHTVQYDGINAICDNRVWRVDVGLSNYYVPHGADPTQVLQIKDGKATVLRL